MKCIICLTTTDKLPSQIICENNHTLHTRCLDKLLSKGFYECPNCRSKLTPIHRYNLRGSDKKYKNILDTNYYDINEFKIVELITTSLINISFVDDVTEYFLNYLTLFKIIQDNIDTVRTFGKTHYKLIDRYSLDTINSLQRIFEKDDVEYHYLNYISDNVLKIK